MWWLIALVSTGIGGLYLAPKFWWGWVLYTFNEVLWLAYAIATDDLPLGIMAVLWFTLGVRATVVSYRKAQA